MAGVCEGVGWYLQVDPTIVRVAFVVASFLAGIGLVLTIGCLIWLVRAIRKP